MSVAVSTAVIGAGALGAGAAIYGANKQSKDNQKAIDANTASVNKADNSAWNNYLLTRGLYTGGGAPTGTIPGMAPGGAVNTKLPFWANASAPAPSTNPLLNNSTPGAGSTWVKKAPGPNTLAGAFTG